MNSFTIMADTTCDLGENYQQEYGIKVIPGHFVDPDETEYISRPAWDVGFTRESFYAALKKNPTGFKTSPPSVGELFDAFSKEAEQGNDILAISISGGMSGTQNFMREAREMTLNKYPERKIVCIDSLRFGPGFGLMVVYAAMHRAAGESIDQVAAWLEENKNRFHQAGWLDDLSFVARQGRLTHAKAFFGTLAGVKPIGEFDYNGMTTVLGKAKGAKKAYEILLGYIEKTIENPEEQIIFIAHTDRLKQAELYKEMIEQKFHPKAVCINGVHPACGINVGPGLMAAYYVGKPISRDLSEERAIIESLSKAD